MVKLFTHDDWDGIGCGILAKYVFGNDVDITYCNFDNINDLVGDFVNNYTSHEIVFITDIRINEALAKLIDEKFNSFYLLDHHESALYLNKYDWCEVRVESDKNEILTSGTELYYNWLIKHNYLTSNKVLDKFVSCVRDYDTYRWAKLGDNGLICKQLNDLLYVYGTDNFMTRVLNELREGTFPNLSETDKLILNIKQTEIDNYIEKKDRELISTTFRGIPCGYIFADRFISELGNKLCLKHPEIDFIAMINMTGSVAYRSVKDNLHLGKDIASIFGGGGHQKAAGSEFSKDIQLRVIQDLFES